MNGDYDYGVFDYDYGFLDRGFLSTTEVRIYNDYA